MDFRKEDLIKSPLNYTGGKFKLLPQILPLFPEEIGTFVDLFTGGCNVGINVKANKIYCNDTMSQIIEIYEYFKNNDIDLIKKDIMGLINKYNLSMTNKEGYLQIREQYNKNRNPLYLFVTICHSFNYSIRFNSKGEFNIAFGKDRSCYNESIKSRIESFKNKIVDINFTNKDFREIKLNNLNVGDFIYADPPYLITVANYNENGGWSENEEIDLLNILDEANNKKIKFALSNVFDHKGRSNNILKEWSKKYNVHYLNYDYKNCNYQGKNTTEPTTEVLITNY